MGKIPQHLAGAGCQVKLKMLTFYMWLIICGFTKEILSADTTGGKQSEAKKISILSPNDDNSHAQSFREKSSNDAYSDPDHNELYRFSRSVPRIKTTSESATDSKSKDGSKHDYVLKVPLSLLRHYELYRLLRWQEQENNENYEKRQTVIPVPRVGRSYYDNEYDMQDTDNRFYSINSEKDNSYERYLDDLSKEDFQNILPLNRNSRSMLLLTSPKSEENAKEKPAQTFVLPYPRPGRSNKHVKTGKSKNEQLILPYPRPGRSEVENQFSEELAVNKKNKKYILPTTRLERVSLDPEFSKEKDSMVIDDWLSFVKSNPVSGKLNEENLSDKIMEENEGNSFFVIPYPRPGKKSVFKLKNTNQKSKNSEKEVTDYVLPYPRPGKKSGTEISEEMFSSKELENDDSNSLIFPFQLHENIHENSFYPQHVYYFEDALNNNQNIDADFTQYVSKEIKPLVKSEDLFVVPIKKSESEFRLPILRTDRSFDNVVPYPRPGRFTSPKNEVSHLLSDDADGAIQAKAKDIQNSQDFTSGIFRFKRSYSVVPYPRFGRSNVIVPYPRPGRSNIVPYPRPGRSNIVPYPRPGRSNSVVPYPRLGRSDAVVPYPRLGRSAFPHTERSKRSSSVVPYPRLGRSDSVVPYPRPGRAESLVPYPRPGRSESLVPYPRPGRAEFAIPYPRPGRAESVVPYPRLGRSESVVPYPRPGRAESVVPYPRPGRADSVVPYPRPGRSQISKSGSPNKNSKAENWLLPNIRPGRSNQTPNNIRNKRESGRLERSVDEDSFEYVDNNGNELDEINSLTRYSRATNGQGYVLPHPRIGRSMFQGRKKRESLDTDTVIPYPRLGRSQKEVIPEKYFPENKNLIHRLNKHVLPNVRDSVYLLPYPRPGRDLH